MSRYCLYGLHRDHFTVPVCRECVAEMEAAHAAYKKAIAAWSGVSAMSMAECFSRMVDRMKTLDKLRSVIDLVERSGILDGADPLEAIAAAVGVRKTDDALVAAYETLGLDPSATLSEARDRYRKLAAAYHPDRVGDDTFMRRLNAAWSTIERAKK
jgi:DnaJ-domain-containing protein 1